MLLCEFVLNSLRSPPSEALLYHTLLELYLSDGRTVSGGLEGDSPTATTGPESSHESSSQRGGGWRPQRFHEWLCHLAKVTINREWVQ